MADGLRDVTGAGLTLGADHGGALGDATQGLTQVGGAADEGDVKGPLVDMIGVVSRAEHLGLVNEVHLEGFQHLGLDEVADTSLGHDGDGDGVDDSLDEIGITHPGHSALGADVGRDTFQGHNGAGSGILGDPRLLGGDDVHDDAALEHVGQSTLDPRGPSGSCILSHVPHRIDDCGS